jgi:pimeloyl-ACP methyl ester carboxylesterase
MAWRHVLAHLARRHTVRRSRAPLCATVTAPPAAKTTPFRYAVAVAERPRKNADDLRGLTKLAVNATKQGADVVQAMHGAIGGLPARIFSAPVYWSIRGITSLVGGTLDFTLERLAPLLGEGVPGHDREIVCAALNGVLGDYLVETKNPLAIELCLHRVEAAAPTAKILVLVHGSSMNRLAWKAARDIGYTPVHLDYNSGLHVSTNGRAFSAALDELVASWPVRVEAITIVAHSMGGLVTRSACHYGDAERRAWTKRLRAIVFLGTPHHGAPLERVGNWVETVLGITRYSAPLATLARIRSAGVTDLRFGYIVEEHWQGRDRFEIGRDARTPVPLPKGVACYAVAAADDALVPLASAMGDHPNEALALGIANDRRFVANGHHLSILQSGEVWDRIEAWLQPADA